jgi:AbrB family looped-hinge helix DNA binding protein
MGITKVTRNYQITLPADVRETLGIDVGDKIIILPEKNEAVIKKVRKDALEKAFGAWGTSRESGVEYTRKIRDEHEKRLRRFGL